MADEEDDDVIHLASFNIHRSQGRRARRQTCITISDDSDEEPLTLVPSRPVLVPDEPDDDVSILEAPARRRMIRPAAPWGRASGRDRPIIDVEEVMGQTATGSVATAVEFHPIFSTSRETQTKTPTTRPLIRPQTWPLPQPGPSTSTLQQPGPSTSTPQQPRPSTSTLQQPGPSTSTPQQPRPSTSTPQQPGPSTSTPQQPGPSTSTPQQPGPSTSTPQQPGPSTSTPQQPRPSTSTPQQPGPSTSTPQQPRPSTSTPQQPGPSTSTPQQPGPSTSTPQQPGPSTSTPQQPGPSTSTPQQPGPSTSTPQQPRPSTSTPQQPRPSTSTPQQPRPSTSTPQQPRPSTSTHPQPGPSTSTHPQPGPSTSTHPQPGPSISSQSRPPSKEVPVAQAQPQLRQVLQALPPFQHYRPHSVPQLRVVLPCTAAAPTVLIAAAPERLGPPETGHRITLGSQAAAGANPNPHPHVRAPGWVQEPRALPLEPQVVVLVNPPAPNLNARVPNPNPNFRVWEANPAPAPNPEGVNLPPLPRVPEPNPLAPALGPALDPARNPPAPALAPVPNAPAPALLPRVEEERPGPSAPRESQEQPHVRALIKGVLNLLPHVHEAYVAELIQKNNINDLNVVCDMLLENPDYPQRESAASAQTSILLETNDTQTPVSEDLFDYAKLGAVGPETLMQAADLLMGDFRMLACHDIKWALNALKGHYAITRKALCEALEKMKLADVDPSGKKHCYINFTFEQGSVKFARKMYFLTKCRVRRGSRTFGAALEASLQKEVSFYQQKAKEQAEHEDFLLALQVNEEQYQKDGQLIECGCCFGEFAFEEMTQCSDGHLFCKECLVKYAQEAVFGSGQSELSCMASGCPCSFPVSELEKVLPENILVKYYERQAEEAVAATCAEELVRCPFCNFPALLDKEVSLFSCPNPRCRKESCRKCHVQWKQHVGKSCEQVLERDEISMRVLFEERMTAARVRKCWKCATGLVKSEGCNRMSCRCGGYMCYLCREPISGYHHFCQHARSPGAPCRQCHKCSLWTDPTQDDERIIQDIQKKGEEELNKKSAENSGKRVGPPPEAVDAKHPRVGPAPQNIAAPPHPQAVRAPLLFPPRVMLAQLIPPLPAPYVPPIPHMPPLANYNVPPVNFNNVELNLPMHYGPPHRRR